MTSDLRALYQDVIVDHGRTPRNFGPLPGANRRAEGVNPLCGDRLTLYLELADGVVRGARFEGSGCAISTASASLMTEAVTGLPIIDVERLAGGFHAMVTGAERSGVALGKLEVLAGVREFPARIKCATLAWHALRAALAGTSEPPGQLERDVVAALRTVFDPEIPVNIYDLGLIYKLDVDPAAGQVDIVMTLTAPGCPVAQTFPQTVGRAVEQVAGVENVHVKLVWEPRWSKEMMSETARLDLGML